MAGFSNWKGGSSYRDLDDYDLYGYGGSTSRGGGLGAEGDRRERKMNRRPSSPGNSDNIISQINQRLDMLTQFEGRMQERGGSERFDQYELFDSHSFDHGPHDPFRSDSYGYEDSRGFRPSGGSGDGDDFDSFDNMWQTRAMGSGRGMGQRPPRRGRAPGGRGFGRGQDSWGGGGRSRGQDKLPSLLANRVYPTSGAYQPQHGSWDYPDRHFEGGRKANRQRGRKKPSNQPKKKRKHSETAADEPSSKMSKTETEGDESDNADPDQMQKTKESEAAPGTATEGKSSDELDLAKEKLQEKQDTPPDKSDNALSIEEELSQLKMKLKGDEVPPEMKPKKKRGFFKISGMKITARRIAFVCSVCKFRTFFREEMVAHLESKYHKDMLKFLSGHLDKRTMEFLQEYMKMKFKNMKKNLSWIEDHNAAVCQVYREQDHTRDIGLEHFIKKAEAAHCAACDLYIPMQQNLIQKHLRSPDHNYNRKRMLEDCKKAGLITARSILNHKPVREKLDRYLKGENPFSGEPDDQDLEDSAVIEADLANERQELAQEEAESAGDRSLPAGEASDNQVTQEAQVMQEVHEEHEEKLEAGGTSQENKEVEEKVEEVDLKKSD